MEDFRSKSCNNGNMQIESYNNNNNGYQTSSTIPTSLQDLRCHSAPSYATSSHSSNEPQMQKMTKEVVVKFKKGKSTNGSTNFKSWSLGDPELQRKKRVVGYNVYTVEGKVKGSLRKSFMWLKQRCTQMVQG